MKPHEILSLLGAWRNRSPEELLSSPAWAMPCRLGEEALTMRAGALRPADPLLLKVRFGETAHTLGLAPSERFPELSRLWSARADIPAPVLLALVERECAPLLQLLENAMRRQMAIESLGGTADENDFCGEVGGIPFTLTRTPQLVQAFGRLAFLDPANEELRNTLCSAEFEYTAFVMPQKDLESMEIGDAVVLPELETTEPCAIVENALQVGPDGAAMPLVQDTLCHVRAAEPAKIRLGDIFDGAIQIPAPHAAPMKITRAGRDIAVGHVGSLAGQPAFYVEKK